jgi:hypothetical protein
MTKNQKKKPGVLFFPIDKNLIKKQQTSKQFLEK